VVKNEGCYVESDFFTLTQGRGAGREGILADRNPQTGPERLRKPSRKCRVHRFLGRIDQIFLKIRVCELRSKGYRDNNLDYTPLRIRPPTPPPQHSCMDGRSGGIWLACV
jgi:hypothetical protein